MLEHGQGCNYLTQSGHAALLIHNFLCPLTINHWNLLKKQICSNWITEEIRYTQTSSSSFWKHDQSKYSRGPSDIAYKLSGGFPRGGLAFRTLLPSVLSRLMASKESKSFPFTTSHTDFKSLSESVSLKRRVYNKGAVWIHNNLLYWW